MQAFLSLGVPGFANGVPSVVEMQLVSWCRETQLEHNWD